MLPLKRLFLFSLFCLYGLLSNTLFCQGIEVDERAETFESGSKNSLSVLITDATPKNIEKAFKDLMKGYKGKVSVKKEIFVDDAQISSISVNTIDIFARIKEEGIGNRLMVSFDLGGATLSSSEHKSQYNAAKKILYDFAVKSTKEGIKQLIKTYEKELSDMIKDGERLKKDNKRLHSDIEKYKQSIITAKKDIEINIKDQSKNITDINAQKQEVNKLNVRKANVK